MQLALRLRHRELVRGLREVVHPDVAVSRLPELVDGEREDRELGLRRRQRIEIDPALRLEEMRHVRVAVERDAVGRGGDHLVERRRKSRHRLQRQPVDQIGVDRHESVGAGGVDHRHRLGLGLDPVHRLLHDRVEILDADRDPVEAQPGEKLDRVGADLARIDLDRYLGIRRKREAGVQHPHQHRHFVAREERRRAAAEVQLLDPRAAFDEAAHDLDLAADVLDVLGRAPVVLGDDLVARAVVADRVAERDVHVQRQRRGGPLVVARGERVDVVLGLDAGVKAISSGVRGVARTEPVVFLHQGGVEDEVGSGGVGHCGSR